MRCCKSWFWLACLGACGSESSPPREPVQGIVFTYPVDQQRDVPLGAHVVVSYALPTDGSVAVVGPDGPVEAIVEHAGGDRTLVVRDAKLAPGTTYQVHVGEGTLFEFTTRSDRPRAGKPAVFAFNGADPTTPGALRPIYETSTLQLVFSEPLDPRTVALEPGAIELVDAQGTAVPATLFARGIHVTLDPVLPFVAGAPYEVRIGDALADLAGERAAATAFAFTPENGLGRGAATQTFRTREPEDPVDIVALTDAGNAIELVHPLIGATSAAVRPSALVTELGDPAVLGGPIAFTIPKGQRLASSAIEIALAGAVPSGLSTGDIAIELVADGGGRIYRNRYRPADTIPTNEEAPMMVDLSLDLAIYATDPAGNAVLSQTILGAQLSGVAFAAEGKFAIETHGAIDINLLGITAAPANLVLDLIDDAAVAITPDTRAPSLVTSLPAPDSHDWVADEGIELVFDEPIDIARARAGGVKLHEGSGTAVPSLIEAHGAVVVIRPRAMLADQRDYHVELADVADASGNTMVPRSFIVRTETVAPTDVPTSVVAIQPGTACALVGANPTSAGRCAGGSTGDDPYRPFALPANERIAIVFSQRLRLSSVVLGATCNTGSVRVERVNAQGACLEPVRGTLSRKGRELAFVPDRPWVIGERYRLRLVSGANATCDANEICGANGRAASFDPLAGTAGAGGPDLVADFVGAATSEATTLFASTSPRSDLNASGHMEQGEQLRDENRVALQIVGTSGLITFASFDGPDCIPSTPVADACMYMLGTIPAQLGARRDSCVLPDGSTAATCVPVAMTAQTMYSTSMAMTAGALGIGIPTETGMTVMRVREKQPLEGYIVERGGKPVMVVALELYMDAPDMSLPIAQHDLHSKPLSVALEGPVTFRNDGRIALSLQNLAEVPITVGINAPLGIQGSVKLVVPVGGMQLQLLSAAQRGGLP